MVVPEILEKSLNILEQITDNVDRLALLNILNCKMAQMISFKGVTFKQYSNSKPCIMSYYAMNFLNSGSNKDYTVDLINNYFLSFLPATLERAIESYKHEFEFNNQNMKEKDLKEELDKIRVANFELQNPNSQGLYREAEQIEKVQLGCLCVRISELGDYLDSVTSGDKNKKELFSKLKEVYEGNIAPSIIAGDGKRKTLNNIPVVALMYTDYENLLNEKIKQYYLTSLKTGMARRSFIFIPQDKVQLCYPKRPKDKENAFFEAKQLEQQFQKIFNMITEKQVYQLSEEAKDLIYDYQCDCIDYFNSSNDNMIIKLERKESFWKIIKLAVIYSIISDPINTVVSSKYVEMAKNFYNAISPSLKTVIEKHKTSEIELYAQFIANNRDKIISNSSLRNANIVNGNSFKTFFANHLDEIKDELLSTYNINLYEYNDGRKNSKSWQCREEI